MGLSRGKFIRVECDSIVKCSSSLEVIGAVLKECYQGVKERGWVCEKGAWICPDCIEDSIVVSAHALKRGKERLNLSKKSFIKLTHKAYMEGITEEHATGALKKYLQLNNNGKYGMYGESDCHIYGEFMYLFSKGKVPTLVTTFEIDKDIKKLVK